MIRLIGSFLFLISLAFALCAQTKEARMFDVFTGFISCEDYLARMDGVFAQKGSEPDSKIYFIVYEGRDQRQVYKSGKFIGYRSALPQKGLAQIRIDSIKRRLSLRKIPLENFVFVSGGFREIFTVEIWIVPKTAQSPKPSPTLKKMKYRKGTPKGFCSGCC
jgi:hypothetical protein